MQNDSESKKSSIIRQNKTNTKTMRHMRLRLYHNKLTNKKIKANKKFSVLLTKEEIEEKIKHFKKIYGPSSSYQICLQALYYSPFQRTVELNNMISYYLRNLKNFIHILSDLKEEEYELTLFQISTHLTYEKYNKNEIICKYGEKADKYYIILKGKVIFLVPNNKKYYMTEEDYIEHLMKLRENEEFELIKNIISNNQYIFYINNTENDSDNIDFDEFIFSALERHEKYKENKYSDYLYYKFKEFKENREKEKNNIDNGNNINNIKKNNIINNYEDYIKITNVNLNEKKDSQYTGKIYDITLKKKFVNILEYQKTNIFTDGDTFGAIGLSTKKGKRTATCISYENCHLGILTKNEYSEFLEKITEKTSNKLYDLIMKNNIFENMIKSKFLMRYAHMFRFIQYNKNNIIMHEKEEMRKLIILYEGEFSLSVNLNLIEINQIMIQYIKIKNKLNNNTKNDSNIKEIIEENKKLLIKMKDYNKDIIDIIYEKNNFVLSNVNNSLILGYPNTVNPDTNISMINCQCISSNAKAYIIEKEMLQLIDKENNYIRLTPDIITSKIDLILKRLTELRTLITKNIKERQQYTTNKISINNNNTITRNLEQKKIRNLSTLVDFNQKIISKDIAKNNLIISQKDFNNNNKLDFSETKMRKDISDKEILLNIARRRSQKFLMDQKKEFKKYVRKANILTNKDKYKDLALIFSNNKGNKEFLDKLKEKLEEDIILEPCTKHMNNKNNKYNRKTNLQLIKDKDYYTSKNIKTMNNINTSNTFNSLFNIFRESFKTDNKHIFDSVNDTFTSFYSNNTTLFNINKKMFLNPSVKNIHTINLNDRDVNCFNKNYQDSYNELYMQYIYDKFKNEKNSINIDSYKSKNLSTSPNKFVFPSIAIFTPEKLKKKENIKKFKYKSISRFRNIGV